jgi:hypothetical protein
VVPTLLALLQPSFGIAQKIAVNHFNQMHHDTLFFHPSTKIFEEPSGQA